MVPTEVSSALKTLLGNDYERGGCHVVWYGSRSPVGDIDLLALQPTPPETPQVLVGSLDMMVMDQDRFDRLLEVLDPLVVEPLLSGEVLVGDQGAWSRLRDRVRTIKADRNVCRHCCQRAMQDTLAASHFWDEYKKATRSDYLKWSFQNLSFAISYMSFCRYYASEGAKACCLSDLADRGIVLMPEFWTYRATVKKTRMAHRPEVVGQMLAGWLDTIAGISTR